MTEWINREKARREERKRRDWNRGKLRERRDIKGGEAAWAGDMGKRCLVEWNWEEKERTTKIIPQLLNNIIT